MTILDQAAEAICLLPNLPRANLVMKLDPSLPEVYADPRELEHAFENLVLNAFQAVSADGGIEIRTHSDGESVFVDDRNIECHMLPLAGHVGEAEIDIFDVIVLDRLEDILGVFHQKDPCRELWVRC